VHIDQDRISISIDGEGIDGGSLSDINPPSKEESIMASNTSRARSGPIAKSAITLHLHEDRPTCSVVRYSDGGDALEWFHDVSLRRALEIAVEQMRLHPECEMEVALYRNGKTVQTLSVADSKPAKSDADLNEV
jgi:hypothetical protein